MDETGMLAKLLESEILSDESKREITETFRTVLESAKSDQEKALRVEFADRYQNDKEKIAEAVEQFVAQRMEGEIQEFHSDMKGLSEQRMKYVNAQTVLKEQAQAAIRRRLAIFEKALHRALAREAKELHEDLKVNRAAALRAITEAKAQSAADRQAFRVKGAKVIEHIINVKLDAQMRALSEDIQKAKQNDFGSRIFEAFMGEARRLFFNSHKELRNAMKAISEQQKTHAAEKAMLLGKIDEVKGIAGNAIKENRVIKENAERHYKTSRLLSTIPSGQARERMKLVLESSPVNKIEQTFKKYASQILSETQKSPQRTQFNEHAVGTRNGNGRNTEIENQDDDDIVNIRRLAGLATRQ